MFQHYYENNFDLADTWKDLAHPGPPKAHRWHWRHCCFTWTFLGASGCQASPETHEAHSLPLVAWPWGKQPAGTQLSFRTCRIWVTGKGWGAGLWLLFNAAVISNSILFGLLCQSPAAEDSEHAQNFFSQTHLYKPEGKIFPKCLKNPRGLAMQRILLDLWQLLVWKELEVRRYEFRLEPYLGANAGLLI